MQFWNNVYYCKCNQISSCWADVVFLTWHSCWCLYICLCQHVKATPYNTDVDVITLLKFGTHSRSQICTKCNYVWTRWNVGQIIKIPTNVVFLMWETQSSRGSICILLISLTLSHIYIQHLDLLRHMSMLVFNELRWRVGVWFVDHHCLHFLFIKK